MRQEIQDELTESDMSRNGCDKVSGFLDSIVAYVTSPAAGTGAGVPADTTVPSARVNASGVLPTLEPWRLRFYTPEPVYYGSVRT